MLRCKKQEHMIAINKVKVKDFLTDSKLPDLDIVINPYTGCPHKCMYCYAEFMKKFTGHSEDWGDFLDVKTSDKHISTARMREKRVLISSATDPYNRFEEEFLNTRRILEQMVNKPLHSVTILTKSSLVLRDMDLFKNIDNITVAISMNTLNDDFRKEIEPFASTISERVEALRILHENGINTSLYISPIFPGITDFKELIRSTWNIVDIFCFENLNLYSGFAKNVLKYIKEKYPDLIDLYRQIYVEKNLKYWYSLQSEIENYCVDINIKHKICFQYNESKK